MSRRRLLLIGITMLALPLAANLVLAWLLIEATTAASALLVAFSGKRSALEAGWKYLLLTTLGLSVALFGIVVLYVVVGGPGPASLDWSSLGAVAAAQDQSRAHSHRRGIDAGGIEGARPGESVGQLGNARGKVFVLLSGSMVFEILAQISVLLGRAHRFRIGG